MRWRNPLAEIGAIAITLILGATVAILFAMAFADGEVRRREVPLSAFLGRQAYEALTRGGESTQHYLGNDRLVPDFTLRAQDGRPWRMSEHRGRVVVLNFWTVTCQPCLEEMPSLVGLSRILAHRDDIELVTISTDRDWDTVRTIVPRGSPLTVLLDPDRAVVRRKFGTRLYPETWVIDPQGVIRLRVDGARDWSSPLALEILESFR
ncbi:MAG: TlpA family protein disulfide reductase [Sandaracinaceae bacterium]|nr:TlpA family protein disulfide reductase [Sandaracinaceae bacterium]